MSNKNDFLFDDEANGMSPLLWFLLLQNGIHNNYNKINICVKDVLDRYIFLEKGILFRLLQDFCTQPIC